ncbi:MAG: diguanylate cyclase [Armatimonadota bacterium]
MIAQETADEIVARLTALTKRGREFREEAMQRLAALPGYEWSGIYRLEGETLRVDAYVGFETDHTEIPVGRGVCGTAIAENRNVLVQDVRELDNYLACSARTRSEIVVLIRRGEEVLGQIDIDGYEVGGFGASDEAMLSRIAALIADRWEE